MSVFIMNLVSSGLILLLTLCMIYNLQETLELNGLALRNRPRNKSVDNGTHFAE